MVCKYKKELQIEIKVGVWSYERSDTVDGSMAPCDLIGQHRK